MSGPLTVVSSPPPPLLDVLSRPTGDALMLGHVHPDADVLGTLVFLQRLEFQHSNGRRRGRAFFDFLRTYFPAQPAVSVAP